MPYKKPPEQNKYHNIDHVTVIANSALTGPDKGLYLSNVTYCVDELTNMDKASLTALEQLSQTLIDNHGLDKDRINSIVVCGHGITKMNITQSYDIQITDVSPSDFYAKEKI